MHDLLATECTFDDLSSFPLPSPLLSHLFPSYNILFLFFLLFFFFHRFSLFSPFFFPFPIFLSDSSVPLLLSSFSFSSFFSPFFFFVNTSSFVFRRSSLAYFFFQVLSGFHLFPLVYPFCCFARASVFFRNFFRLLSELSPVSFLLLSLLVHSFRILGSPVYTRFIIFYRCYRVCFAASATFSDSSLSSLTAASFLLSFVFT